MANLHSRFTWLIDLIRNKRRSSTATISVEKIQEKIEQKTPQNLYKVSAVFQIAVTFDFFWPISVPV